MDPDSQPPRQSILGSFLRGSRPRSSTTNSMSAPALAPDTTAAPPAVPNLPSSHRRRPATALNNHTGLSAPTSTFSQIIRRRRSANEGLSFVNTSAAQRVAPALPSAPPSTAGPPHRIRFVPHLESTRSLHFEPVVRDCREGGAPLRIGRFTDRNGGGTTAGGNKIAFKSKVVSRGHAEVWCEPGGKFFIKDTSSSSGTFLNHIRLSGPGTESRPFALKDGDVLQLGVDYQGGTEEIYRCVKIRIELNREWQAGVNAFNSNAMKQLKALSNTPSTSMPVNGKEKTSTKSGVADCCICLFQVTVCQALFIAPCSHAFHYKCIRPMLTLHHPGFCCPLCRTFSDLDEDVEVDPPVSEEAVVEAITEQDVDMEDATGRKGKRREDEEDIEESAEVDLGLDDHSNEDENEEIGAHNRTTVVHPLTLLSASSSGSGFHQLPTEAAPPTHEPLRDESGSDGEFELGGSGSGSGSHQEARTMAKRSTVGAKRKR